MTENSLPAAGAGARPLVSIIMPTYNREKLLPVALKSILNQSYSNWELLVVDDRSTDHTRALIEEYSKRDGRIRYMVNERSKGPGGARNYGILHAVGAYIAFLDSDDEWLEHHLSASLDVLLTENVKLTLAANYKRIHGKLITNNDDNMYEELERALMILKPRVEGKLVFFGRDFFEYNVMERFNMYHINTIVMEREVLEKVGLFNEALPVNEDYDLLFRIFHDYEFCFINDYHFIYNFGDDNLYAYTFREELLKNGEAFEDEALVKKLAFTLDKRIIAYNYRKELVRNSSRIRNADSCIKQIDNAISRAYLSLGYINMRRHKLKAAGFFFKSMSIAYSKLGLMLLGRLIFPAAFKEALSDPLQLRL